AAARLAQLADLVLAQEEDVARHLAEAAGDEAEPAAELDEIVALAVPRHGRHGEIELLRQRRLHRRAVLAERREIAGGAAEAHHLETYAQRVEAVLMAQQRRQPARRLQPEGGWCRLLAAGACQHDRAALVVGQGREARADLVQALL